MTLVEALKTATHNQVIAREYTLHNGMTFTQWCTAEVVEVGRFIKIEWGGKIKLDDLEADNWKLQ